MFTVDDTINTEISDQWIQYRTLRFKGMVRGQLISQYANAICHALNASLVSGELTQADFIVAA